MMEAGDSTDKSPPPLALTRFQLSEEYGFLLPRPLVGNGCATASVCHRSWRPERPRGWRGLSGWVSVHRCSRAVYKCEEEDTWYFGLLSHDNPLALKIIKLAAASGTGPRRRSFAVLALAAALQGFYREREERGQAAVLPC